MRNYRSVFLALFVMLCFVSLAQAQTNLALNKSVTAGSSDWGALETFLVDGVWDVTGEGWSADAVPNWAEIDLGQDYSVSSIKIGPYMRSEDARWNYNSSWTVKYKAAGDANWKDFAGVVKAAGAGTLGSGISITNGNPGHNNSDEAYKTYIFNFTPVAARYVRYDVVVGDGDNDINGNEIEVYGDVLEPPIVVEDQLTFSWSHPDPTTAEGYRLYMSENSGQYIFGAGNALAVQTGGGSTSLGPLTISFEEGKTYYFALTAYNSGGESGPSNEVSYISDVYILNNPTNLKGQLN